MEPRLWMCRLHKDSGSVSGRESFLSKSLETPQRRVKGERVCDGSRASSPSDQGGTNQAVKRSRSELCEGAVNLLPNSSSWLSLGRAGGDAWHSESCEDGDTLSSLASVLKGV